MFNVKIHPIAILVENKKALNLLRRKLSPHKFHSRCNKFLFETDYRGIKILLLEMGMGKEKIDYRISSLFKEHHNIGLAVFLGFMGALEKNMKVGDIVIPSFFIGISDPGEEYQSNPELLDFCRTLQDKNNFKLHLGKKNLTVDKVYLGDDKIRLRQTNPDISTIDMESFDVAKILSKKKVPFIVIKAVSDDCNFIFKNFKFLFGEECQMNLIRFLLYCIINPLEILNLINFLKDLRKALKNNTSFIVNFLNSLI